MNMDLMDKIIMTCIAIAAFFASIALSVVAVSIAVHVASGVCK